MNSQDFKSEYEILMKKKIEERKAKKAEEEIKCWKCEGTFVRKKGAELEIEEYPTDDVFDDRVTGDYVEIKIPLCPTCLDTVPLVGDYEECENCGKQSLEIEGICTDPGKTYGLPEDCYEAEYINLCEKCRED